MTLLGASTTAPGDGVGEAVGDGVGVAVGDAVGDGVGDAVGDGVGDATGAIGAVYGGVHAAKTRASAAYTIPARKRSFTFSLYERAHAATFVQTAASFRSG